MIIARIMKYYTSEILGIIRASLTHASGKVHLFVNTLVLVVKNALKFLFSVAGRELCSFCLPASPA